MPSGVYLIRNRLNGRRYVGSAVNIEKRWREHLRQLTAGKHHSRFLQRCWDKHGEEAFEFVVIVECERALLIETEQRFIDELRPEYNSSPTAGSQLGYKHTQETKKKMAEAARRTRNFTGKRHSEVSKQKISEKKSGRLYGNYSPERVGRAAEAMRESKRAMTEAEVRIIRRLKAAGLPHREVAQWVGRSYWAIADVVRNRTFQWVK